VESTSIESLSEFMDSLREIDLLLSVEPSRSVESGLPRGKQSGRELSNAITRSCMVMLVAHFEGFVKSALSELVHEICAAKPPTSRIPDPLLELMTRGRIEEIFGTSGPDRIHRTRKLFTSYAQLWDDGRVIDPRLLSDKILMRQFTNARPEVIQAVFALLDIADAMAEIETSVNTAIASRGDEATTIRVDFKLKEIVERRNSIAHGDRDEMPTPLEVENYKVFLSDVARAIAEMVHKRIEYCCSLR
jgi:hypothetical protein